MHSWTRPAVALLLAITAAACGGSDEGVERADESVVAAGPQDAFFTRLASMCGQAYRGEAVLASGSGFEGEMVMHVRRCTDSEIQIPLHVGENRSRTWIITRTPDGLRLKHDHRLEDGTDDPVTQYGGDTATPGTATEQSFPADAYTAELIPDAATNVWTITLTDDQRLVYHLERHGAPRATFEFDLSESVEPPPAPWGYEGT